MTNQAASPRIAIVGGGPGGLTLARLLERRCIDYVVYERDESDDSICTGGSLDIHPETGQHALREAGLLQDFLRHASYEDTVVSLADKSGNKLIEVGSGSAKPEIDRVKLRQILLDSIPKHRIKWGHVLKLATMGKDQQPILNFSNGVEASGFGLIVGADGAWSKVRTLVTQARPTYTGKAYIESRIARGNPHYDVLVKSAGAGLNMSIDNGTPIVIQRQGDGSYRFYFGLQVPEDYFRSGAIDLRNVEGTRHLLLSEVYADWAEEYKDLIRQADSLRAWMLYTLSADDVGWKSVPGATLVGDAAHVAYPGGSGVNLAMLDALRLTSKIVEHGSSNLDVAVREYEREMFPRGIKAIAEGNAMAELMFSPNPQPFHQLLKGSGADE